jgi:predicted PurR-regulated permease PerM
MVNAVVKVLTFFVVVILILLLLNILGGFIAAQIPDAVQALDRIIEALWNALQDITAPRSEAGKG